MSREQTKKTWKKNSPSILTINDAFFGYHSLGMEKSPKLRMVSWNLNTPIRGDTQSSLGYRNEKQSENRRVYH